MQSEYNYVVAYFIHELHCLNRETVHYWITQVATSTMPLQHIEQHLRDANEAVESAHSALAALKVVLPASLSHTMPWIPGSPK